MNQQHLFYHFLAKPDDVEPEDWLDDAKNVKLIRSAFDEWNTIVGIRFEETDDVNEAQIKIGFLNNNGCWSFLGRDILEYGPQDPYQRTMNFGWNIYEDPRTKGVALHEIGHTLDFPHEHQNPKANFKWNVAATIRDFQRSNPDWTDDDVWAQVMEPITEEYEASAFDEKSIMGYDIRAGLIRTPKQYNRTGLAPGDVLSTNDIRWAKIWYPKSTTRDVKEAKAAAPLQLTENELLAIPNDSKNTPITFTPSASTAYGIHVITTGDVFFLLADGTKVLKGKDTEGGEKHPKIFYDLKRNKEYTITVRVNGLKDDKEAVYVTAYKQAA
jgi:hypothetical protein